MEYCSAMLEESRDFSWETSVRMSCVGRDVEELGLMLEGGRKRKWQEGGKMMRREEVDEREQRRMPPKKIIAAVGDMGGSGASSASSHLSPGWQVNDLDLDLPGELSMNEALLSLAVFKQEAPSPPGAAPSPRHAAWQPRVERQITNMAVDAPRDAMEEGCQQSPPHNVMSAHGSPENMECNNMGPAMTQMGYSSQDHLPENKSKGKDQAGLLMCSPVSSLEGFLHSPVARHDNNFNDDTRFQYVLAAATSIATKTTEESLTYLNQGQPYEVKLKKLGDLSHFKGKILKSVIKICFHERRLQYMEREQIAQWHAARPGERIVEVDVPLSYGVIKVQQPACLNALHVYWDPFKDVGVYIKVNCISTEFTAKKHGGEKGVPFRIQVETYLASDETCRLHAAACQIKVFKLKGADRKHKQDREKVMRRPRPELELYQPGCEATVLTTLSNDAMQPPPSLVTSSPPYSPEMCVAPKSSGSPVMMTKPVQPQPAILASPNQMKPLYCQDASDMKVSSPPSHSPGAILPDLPQEAAPEVDKSSGLSKDASASETQAWLARHRFTPHASTFANFSGADLLRLSRDDIIQICGLADGIRLFNALHAKRISPRLTVYVCAGGCDIYSAVYLHSLTARGLADKLRRLLPPSVKVMNTTSYTTQTHVAPSHGVRVRRRLRHIQRRVPALADRARPRRQAEATAAAQCQGMRHGPGGGPARRPRASHRRAGAPSTGQLHIPRALRRGLPAADSQPQLATSSGGRLD
ncbi:transcription factor CP2 isoform X3 [Plutella xylostella]|uniref:transcription factor CP2 isoform X3 n=1 Tax=Plutella xylostella TaxID=51655 RepID=UPI00203270A4|nr:transcription factor CP2 isoform X3 [Plutella xylostella]